MFQRKTVFVLGAGASIGYGYPLGIQLIDDIVNAIENDEIFVPRKCAYNYFSARVRELSLCDWEQFKTHKDPLFKNFYKDKIGIFSPPNLQFVFDADEQIPLIPGYYAYDNVGTLKKAKLFKINKFQELVKRIKEFHPISIDNFLRDHTDLAEVGRIMIAYVLLKKENRNMSNAASSRNCWYRFLLNDITNGCGKDPSKIELNDLNILTFNYSMDIEFYLRSCLTRMEFFKANNKNYAEEWVDKFLKNNIYHIYGSLCNKNKINFNGFENGYGYFSAYDKLNHDDKDYWAKLNTSRFVEAFNVMKDIKLIQDRDEEDDKAKILLQNAQDIKIIGFAFDSQNQKILGFPNVLKGKNKKLFYLDYDGKLNTLYSELNNYLKGTETEIIRSTATSSEVAYQSDFGTRLFLGDQLAKNVRNRKKASASHQRNELAKLDPLVEEGNLQEIQQEEVE